MLTQPDAPLITALLFGPLLLGVFQHLLLDAPARAWHTTLNKSPYRPPPPVFPLAWVWSYLSLGCASCLVYRAHAGPIAVAIAAAVYAVHLVLLSSWGIVFLARRRIDHGLNVMLALDVTACWLLAAVYNVRPFAAALCVPYCFWLLELTYLNAYMERNNPPSQSKEEVFAAHAAPSIEHVDAAPHPKDE